MEPKQHANLHQSAESFRGMNMQANLHGSQSSSLLVQMSQPESRLQMLNDTNGSHLSRLPSSVTQPALLSGMASGVLARKGIVDNAHGAVYYSVSQASSMVDFSIDQNIDLPGNSFPLGNNSGISSITSKGVLQEEHSEMKGSRGFAPSYDILSELHEHKSRDWELQNVDLTFDASGHANVQGNLDVPPSVSIHQGFSSRQNSLQSRNTYIDKVMFSAGEESGHGNASNLGQPLDTLLTDNSVRVKAERITEASYQNTLFPQQFSQEDFMSALLKQQDFIGHVPNEFSFDGYPLDNLPVYPCSMLHAHAPAPAPALSMAAVSGVHSCCYC